MELRFATQNDNATEAFGEGERQMIRQVLGILGCVLLAAAISLALAVVFFERAIIAAGIPYHALNCSVLAAALFGVAIVCGFYVRGTPTGKVALVGGLVLGSLFVGIISWVVVAFIIEG
jgi:hypothetical protein